MATRLDRLKQLRDAAMLTAEDLPDEKAVKIPTMFEAWAPDTKYVTGDRRSYEDLLYKCRQDHTSQADWTPDVTPAMWEVIDETHAGTLEDPIPAARNMAYENGKYYLDPEDEKIYLCNRDTEIPVAYLPHELIGQYFEEATTE